MADDENDAYEIKERTRIVKIVLIFTVIIVFGTFMYHYLENWNYIDSFYFAVSTLTTVGYGEIVPSTPTAKLFTSFYILLGVSIFFYGLFSIGEHFVEERITKLERRIQRQTKRR